MPPPSCAPAPSAPKDRRYWTKTRAVRPASCFHCTGQDSKREGRACRVRPFMFHSRLTPLGVMEPLMARILASRDTDVHRFGSPICADPCRAKPVSVTSVVNSSPSVFTTEHTEAARGPCGRLRRCFVTVPPKTSFSAAHLVVHGRHVTPSPCSYIPNTFRVFCDGQKPFCVFRGIRSL